MLGAPAPAQRRVGDAASVFRVFGALEHGAKYTPLLNCEIQHLITSPRISRRPLLPVDLLLILIVVTFSKICSGWCGTEAHKGLAEASSATACQPNCGGCWVYRLRAKHPLFSQIEACGNHADF